jgi:hypothetical protein
MTSESGTGESGTGESGTGDFSESPEAGGSLGNWPISPPFPAMPWAASVIVCLLVAWLLHNFAPVAPPTPKEFVGVDLYSPADLQEKADDYFNDLEVQVRFRRMSMLGAAFGFIPMLFFLLTRRRGWLLAGLIALAIAVPVGAGSAVVGVQIREALGPGVKILFVNAGSRPLFVDSCVFVAITMMLLLPAALSFVIAWERQRLTKLVAVLLGGALGGLAATTLTVLGQTQIFPPKGMGLTAVWLTAVALLVALLTTKIGPAPVATEE